MNDILMDTEKTFKEMIKVWQDAVGRTVPHKKPLSYQRFKLLRSIGYGLKLIPDICEDAGLDRSTTASMLHEMLKEGLVLKSARDNRAYLWTLTDNGKSELERTKAVLDSIMNNLKFVFTTKMEEWI